MGPGPGPTARREENHGERERPDSFGAKGTLDVDGKSYEIYRLERGRGRRARRRLAAVQPQGAAREPAAHRGRADITADDIKALAGWDADAEPDKEIQFTPARVIMQDFTGVPCVVDLATMREAMEDLGGDPSKINPLAPAEMVIDHSVIADVFGTPEAFERNVEIEYERNKERYQFLRWGQGAFDDFKVVPPGTGIVHQVNIEHLARVVFTREVDGEPRRTPTRSSAPTRHTTMVNGIGVVGWGVGGIEAEAAMLGQPVSMLIPRVVGFKLNGELPEGATATDLVLTDHRDAARARCGRQVRGVLRTRRLRAAAGQPRHDRQHEPGVRLHDRGLPDRRGDDQVPRADRPRRRSSSRWSRPTPRSRASGTTQPDAEPRYSEKLELDLAEVVPVARRAQAPAGPGLASPTPRRPSAPPWPTTSTATEKAEVDSRSTRQSDESFPSSDAPAHPRAATAAASRRRRAPAGRRTAARKAHGDPRATARSSRSTTARSRSPRSRRAPTPPTPR